MFQLRNAELCMSICFSQKRFSVICFHLQEGILEKEERQYSEFALIVSNFLSF